MRRQDQRPLTAVEQLGSAGKCAATIRIENDWQLAAGNTTANVLLSLCILRQTPAERDNGLSLPYSLETASLTSTLRDTSHSSLIERLCHELRSKPGNNWKYALGHRSSNQAGACPQSPHSGHCRGSALPDRTGND